MMRLFVISAALSLWLGSAPAAAQDAMFSTFAGDTATNLRNTSIRDSMLGVDTLRRGAPRSSVTPRFRARPPAVSSVPTTYRRAPAVTQRVGRQYVDWLAKSSPQDAERVRRALAAADPVQTWSRYVAEDGVHVGDVADAVASYWVLNWLIVNGGDTRPGQMQAVRRRIQPTIASDPAFARLSEAQRQEMAEVLMINFIFQRDTYLHAVQTHDEPLLAKARAAAVTRFQREAGLDLRRIALTDQGFRPRG